MPADALPQAHAVAGPLEGSHCLRRTYRDPLGRPMSGTVRIIGQARTESGNTVVPPAPVKVELVDGRLDVHLPPDSYRLEASLTTVDGERLNDVSTVELD